VRIIPGDIAQIVTAAVALGMMATPVLAMAGRRLGQQLQGRAHREDILDSGDGQLSGHVVIGGFGRVGQMIARLLSAENVPYIALDTNAELVTEQRKSGHSIYFGDAGRLEFLERAGAARARAFVVTVNAPKAAERMVVAARRVRPGAPVFARASDAGHAARLIALGAVGVIPETVEASLQLGARLLESLGLPDEAVDRRIAEMRGEELGRLGAKGPDAAKAVAAMTIERAQRR
jgi:CPA2 family monovalent cation:H+ antiporter-2